MDSQSSDSMNWLVAVEPKPVDARCSCGCRIFFNKQVIITTANGSIRDIPSVMVLDCVRCARTYLTGTGEGRKELIPFKADAAGEKFLFEGALESWKNTHHPERNQSHIVIDEADKLDFMRLGVNQ